MLGGLGTRWSLNKEICDAPNMFLIYIAESLNLFLAFSLSPFPRNSLNRILPIFSLKALHLRIFSKEHSLVMNKLLIFVSILNPRL